MSEPVPLADWSRLHLEPDLPVPLPGGGQMLFRRIPRGSFIMGARGEGADKEPRHRVVILQDFYLGKFVVTQAEWRPVAALSRELRNSRKIDPSDKVNTGDRRPVTDVSWDDAVAWSEVFAPLMVGVAGLPAGLSARLPTEAEWEYACRAGTETEYYNGDGEATLPEVAWFGEDYERGAHAVDERAEQHPAGLHGMHGNVWEWSSDAYYIDAYRRRFDGVVSPEEHLRGEDEHSRRLRVVRGGSWDYSAGGCRSASRLGWCPGGGFGSLGFRLCLAPGPAAGSTETEQKKAAGGSGRRAGSKSSDAAGAGVKAPEIPDLATARLPRRSKKFP